ncbi:NmrA-domain-containing protein [Penicillium cosmopolitanum]|uniref:NmrA-domain-containing protein n=1 Tax=Penicillium cosmopolitanum TaxID=1131564 RepID=A0A9W9WC33_9EURO|nr:NmrA-domain-containing protein [Penicillium cosmopolitanum]KAJ5414699.1 NmrA-domain-containing protein [Penicillium cosmopolitanum]
MSKPIIVVFGATGKQGGSVVSSLLADNTASKFNVRAITRDVTKPSAKALALKGAQVVAADLSDNESVKKALKGAYGVYAVTNYWDHHSADLEFAQGKGIADACKEEGIQHLVWSSLLDVTKLSGGVLSQVHHFDSKAKVEAYIRSEGIPATFMLPGFYMSNIAGGNLRKTPEGIWKLALPIPGDSPIPLFASEYDTGKFVKSILLKRDETLGKRIYAATKYYTPLEILATFKNEYPNAGKDAAFAELPHAVFKSILAGAGMPAIAQEELLENMRLMPEFGYYGGEALDSSVEIVDEPLTTWSAYMGKAQAFADLD